MKKIAKRRNQSWSEIIREAVDRYIDDELNEVNVAEALEKSFGIWADRDDLDGFFEAIRREQSHSG